jgi:branched-chain amino acid transport system substrate-binding protein
VLILKQRLVAGIPAIIPIVGANGLNTPAIIRGVRAAANGVIVGTIYNPSAASTRNLHFRAAFTHRYGHSPDLFAAQGYDGIYTLAAALRRAHTTDDRSGLRAALAGLKDVPSLLPATGHFSFTPQREANLTPAVQIVHRGEFIPFR